MPRDSTANELNYYEEADNSTNDPLIVNEVLDYQIDNEFIVANGYAEKEFEKEHKKRTEETFETIISGVNYDTEGDTDQDLEEYKGILTENKFCIQQINQN